MSLCWSGKNSGLTTRSAGVRARLSIHRVLRIQLVGTVVSCGLVRSAVGVVAVRPLIIG